MAQASQDIPDPQAGAQLDVGMEEDPTGALGFLSELMKKGGGHLSTAAMGSDPAAATKILKALTFNQETPPGGVPGGGADPWQSSVAPSGAGAGPSGGAPGAPGQAGVKPAPFTGPVPGDVSAFAQRVAPQPEFVDKLAAFFAGMGQGNGKVLPALGHGWLSAINLGPQMEQQQAKITETYKALRGAGASHSEAMAAMLDPKVSEKVLGELMPWNLKKPVEAGTDIYGQKQMITYDPGKAGYGGGPSAVGAGTVGQLTDPATGEMLRGQPFLDALGQHVGPAIAERVRKTARGELPFPSGIGAKSGIGARMADWVTQYDGNFNVNDSQARAKVWKDFADGPIANNLNAFGLLTQHAKRMAGTIEKLGNYSSPYVNMARGAFGNAVGPQGSDYAKHVEAFNAQKNGVSHELGNVLKGGPATVSELHTAAESLDANKAPEIQRNNLVTVLDMAKDRLNQVKERWDSTYRGSEPYPQLVTKAEKHLNDAYAALGAPGGEDGAAGASETAPAQPAILGVPQGAPGQGGPGQGAPTAPLIAPGASPLGGPGQGAPAGAPEGPVFNAPAPQPAPGGPAVLNPTAAPQPPAQAGLQNASFTPPPPAPAPGGQFANLPVVTDPMQIEKIPVGKFFKTPTSIFQRIEQAPGFVKIMDRKTEDAPAPTGGGGSAPAPAGPASGGPALAPAPSGGGQAGMQTASAGGRRREVGANGIVYDFLGGDETNPNNWKAITRSLVA